MLCLVTQSCLTLCDPMDCSLPGSSVHGDSPGKNTGVGCHALLQGIFPTRRSIPGLPHCSQILYCLSHQGSPKILEWVAYPFFRGSSQPRNWTGVSCIAGRFFTSWVIQEASNRILYYIILGACHFFFPFSIISWRFIQVVACINIFFLFIAEYYSLICLYHHLFKHSPVQRHLGWFQFLAVTKLLWTFVYKFYMNMFPFLWYICPGV